MTEMVTSGSMSGEGNGAMDFSARATTKDAARLRRRRSCTPPRFSSTLPHTLIWNLRCNTISNTGGLLWPLAR